MTKQRLLTSLALIACTACAADSGAGLEETGTVLLELVQVPAAVKCVALESTNPVESRVLYPVTPGASEFLDFGGLPQGSVSISGEAYDKPCTEVTEDTLPTWVATPVTATVVAGQLADVKLTFLRAGGLRVSADFVSPPACGNNVVEGTETCDDGNVIPKDGCSETCQTEFFPGCGNARLESGETCDDGNLVAGDGCSATCQKELDPTCGNGLLNKGETCDDGNILPKDGCSETCQTEPSTCGNGLLDKGETCDDGNIVSGDGCGATCQVEPVPTCGNKLLDRGETCDDGNRVAGDGCSVTCQVEPCGNKTLDRGETCDDGNRVPGDGCSSSCQIEPKQSKIDVKAVTNSGWSNVALLTDGDASKTAATGTAKGAWVDLEFAGTYLLTMVRTAEDNAGTAHLDEYEVQCWNGSSYDLPLFRDTQTDAVRPLFDEHPITMGCVTNKVRIGFYNDGAVEVFEVELYGIPQ